MKNRKINKPLIITASIFLLVIFIVIIAAVLIVPRRNPIRQKESSYNLKSKKIDSEKWLSNIDDNELINNINIPGTHDSCAFNIPLSFKARTQEIDILKQLKLGVRYLDIRLMEDKDDFILSHSFIKCLDEKNKNYTFKKVLNQVKTFLKENPSEFILINIKKEKVKLNFLNYTKKLKSIIENNIDKNMLYTDSKKIPRLSEVRGKVIIARREKDTNYGLSFIWDHQSDKKYNKNKAEKIHNFGAYSLKVQDHFKLNKNDKKEAILSFFAKKEKINNLYTINFFSSTGNFINGPKTFVDCIEWNQELFDKMKEAKGQIIVLDFSNKDKVEFIIKTNKV